ncbi:oxidoreductase [Salmonella enterica subsp. arizonae]|nr:oxidoreductase [Salmonella enterica subsp. arizonae]
MPQENYLDELTVWFTPLLAIKEASRCLLCHDGPPVGQDCPAQTDPRGNLFVLFISVILKAQRKTIRKK